jgi:hypothetical protein
MSIIKDEELSSPAPFLKASDHVGLNAVVKIKSGYADSKTFDGEEQHGYALDVGKDKPIWLSKGNLKLLVAEFSNDTDNWAGKTILLTTKAWDISGNKTTGWITNPIKDADKSAPNDDIPF